MWNHLLNDQTHIVLVKNTQHRSVRPKLQK